MTSASCMHEAGQTGLVLCDNLEGGGGEEGGGEGAGEEDGGRGVWMGGHMYVLWPIHVDVWQKSPQYCKVIILQLK